MKVPGGSNGAKRRAGEHAADHVTEGMIVGLGTGSTAAFAIDALGQAVDAGLDITGVPTSYQSRETARAAGIPLVALEDITHLDFAIDGADQVAGLTLLKGGGAAHTREKIVAAAADQFHVVVDESKLADRLDQPVPVEILPDTRRVVAEAIREAGGEPELRGATGKDGPIVTDNGNLVLDCDFGQIEDPNALAVELSLLPGVVDHGLFVEMAHTVHIGSEQGVESRGR